MRDSARRREILNTLRRAEEALDASPPDTPHGDILEELRHLALLPGGFVSNDIRKRVWPLLLGFSPDATADFYRANRIKLQLPPFPSTVHPDDAQIHMDVNRSLGDSRWRDVKGLKRAGKRKALFSLLHATMCISHETHYNQGFHDVASVVLLAVGMPLSIPLTTRMSQTFFREPMRKNFDTVLPVFRLLYPLLRSQDPVLVKHIATSVDQAYFALPWVLTWFSHHLDAFHDVARLFDVLLCSHPLFSLYLSAALVLRHRQTIVQVDADDFGEMHSTLQRLGSRMADDMDATIRHAADLFHNIPPQDLLAQVHPSMDTQSSCLFEFPFPHQRRLGARAPPTPSTRQLERKYMLFFALAVGILAATLATTQIK
ncbi:Aste57867_51 [Aphanomyces stellatus]|uniref:Aste57867_51 protein n=1 Tax=Aphanomyces stellatus TaxID=120398 RepID=A0A485K2V2_9STRA|nr:hypothetical protein As57867_000051 [Aphanomyces stellatus]VFT77277.1 Aste57867_51 [Aphanomyces stellatus]